MDLVIALAVFCVVTLFTPGPNNVMLMTSGLNFGIRRGLPHLLGVTLGFTVMVLAIGLGLGAVFEAWPVAYTVLKYAGAAYLLYLAWQIATSAPPSTENASKGRPISFLQAVAFQWVNPKAWVMAVGAASTYAAIAPFPFNMFVIAAFFGVLGLASSGTWLGLGAALQHLLKNPRAVRIVNVVMALLLVASLYPILADDIPL
ncbi:MAG TPA: LysE family translocator [Casimicrobiaceae bacterium]|nr:LysE family translocator [Casimicrobiaceae bacterium]